LRAEISGVADRLVEGEALVEAEPDRRSRGEREHLPCPPGSEADQARAERRHAADGDQRPGGQVVGSEAELAGEADLASGEIDLPDVVATPGEQVSLSNHRRRVGGDDGEQRHDSQADGASRTSNLRPAPGLRAMNPGLP
jgi:hypothetical protein